MSYVNQQNIPNNIVVPGNCNKRFSIEWVIIFIIFTIVIIILIIFLARLYVTRIDPQQCPRLEGSYGVMADQDGQVIAACGSSLNEPCISTQPTLAAAIAECENRSDICQRFSYNSSNQTFKIINNSNLQSVNGINVYTKQVDYSQ